MPLANDNVCKPPKCCMAFAVLAIVQVALSFYYFEVFDDLDNTFNLALS